MGFLCIHGRRQKNKQLQKQYLSVLPEIIGNTQGTIHVYHEASNSLIIRQHMDVLMLLFLSSYILLLQFPHMSANLTRNPSGRVNRIYTAQERAAIDPFKAQYMEATSPAAQKIIAQVHILPALFNYWVSIGQVMDQKKMQIRMGVRSTILFNAVFQLTIVNDKTRNLSSGSRIYGVPSKRFRQCNGVSTC